MLSSEQTLLAPIKQLDLKRQLDVIRAEIDAAMTEVMNDTAFIGGEVVSRFESEFAEFCQVSYCIGVGNGTDALDLIFRALDLQPGDEVITTPMSFIATVEPLLLRGVRPVFVDIDSDTYNLNSEIAAKKITKKTKALLPVHLYGQPADMGPLLNLAKQHDLFMIEDAAQAHGATYGGKRIGSLGDAAAFSFYPGKNLGAFGDGGAVTTSNESLAQRIRMLADHGRMTKYEHELVGVNSRLDALQAAVLHVKLKYLADWNQKRRQWAALYDELLADVSQVRRPMIGSDRTTVYHQYVLRLQNSDDRESFMSYLKAQGVHTGIHYPLPLHLQPALKHLGYHAGDFPVAEQLASACVSLPMFAELTEAEVHRVAETVRQFFVQH